MTPASNPDKHPEKHVVFAVEFTCSTHHAHTCHRAVRVGEFPDYEAARKGAEAFRQAQAGSDGPQPFLGFTVWPTDQPEKLPAEMWIDLEV